MKTSGSEYEVVYPQRFASLGYDSNGLLLNLADVRLAQIKSERLSDEIIMLFGTTREPPYQSLKMQVVKKNLSHVKSIKVADHTLKLTLPIHLSSNRLSFPPHQHSSLPSTATLSKCRCLRINPT